MSKPVNNIMPALPGRNPLQGVPAPPRFQTSGAGAKFELPREDAPPAPNNGGAGEVVPTPASFSPLSTAKREIREKGQGSESESGTPIIGGGGGQNAAKPGTDPKLQEATREWEAFFVGYLLKQMRKTAGDGGGLFKPSEGEKMFRDMLDDETARSLSKTGGLGLADMLNRELGAAHARAGAEKGER